MSVSLACSRAALLTPAEPAAGARPGRRRPPTRAAMELTLEKAVARKVAALESRRRLDAAQRSPDPSSRFARHREWVARKQLHRVERWADHLLALPDAMRQEEERRWQLGLSGSLRDLHRAHLVGDAADARRLYHVAAVERRARPGCRLAPHRERVQRRVAEQAGAYPLTYSALTPHQQYAEARGWAFDLQDMEAVRFVRAVPGTVFQEGMTATIVLPGTRGGPVIGGEVEVYPPPTGYPDSHCIVSFDVSDVEPVE